MQRIAVYPFCGIVGQDDMKLALILNVINPGLGGVLIKGEKGTAKSTAVRALAELLPEMDSISGCKFNCHYHEPKKACSECSKLIQNNDYKIKTKKMKVVELPVSATEDRVVGTLDIEHAIKFGEKKFETGILGEANNNILYVDEINLLDDHVVDVLLDAAAMGINTVEREGVSFSHPSRFVLVGTMNPEEGDIRPQLLDRFALSVVVGGEKDIESRTKVIKSRLAYEESPEEFIASFEQEQANLGLKIMKARALLSEVSVSDELLTIVAKISIALAVDGHRADITLIKTAKTIAAFDGRTIVNNQGLKAAAKLVLSHRMRRRPFEEGILDMSIIEEIIG